MRLDLDDVSQWAGHESVTGKGPSFAKVGGSVSRRHARLTLCIRMLEGSSRMTIPTKRSCAPALMSFVLMFKSSRVVEVRTLEMLPLSICNVKNAMMRTGINIRSTLSILSGSGRWPGQRRYSLQSGFALLAWCPVRKNAPQCTRLNRLRSIFHLGWILSFRVRWHIRASHISRWRTANSGYGVNQWARSTVYRVRTGDSTTSIHHSEDRVICLACRIRHV